MISTKKHIKNIYIVSSIAIIFAVLNIWYIINTKTSPSWDQALHLELSLIYYDLINQGQYNQIIHISNYYPPFFHLSSYPLYKILGVDLVVSRLTNVIYIVLSALSIFGISNYLFSKKVGIIASMTFLMYPLTIGMQKTYLSELALTAMISVTIYFLLKSDTFNNFNYSVLFGLSFACAELTKWTAVFFIIGPLIYAIYQKYKTKSCLFCGKRDVLIIDNFCSKQCQKKYNKNIEPQFKDQFKRNIIIALSIAVIVAGLWYIPNFTAVKNNLLQGQQYWGTIEGEPNPLTVESFLWYIEAVHSQIYLVFSILLIVSIIYLLKSDNLNTKLFFGLSILTPYIVFTLTKNKSMRYTMPLLIFYAIITAWFLYEAQIRYKLGKLLMIGILLVASIQVSSLYFGYPQINPKWYPGYDKPSNEDWQIESMIELMHDKSDNGIVVVLSDHRFINGRTFSYYSKVNNYNFNVYNAAYIPSNDFSNGIDNVEFVIYKDGGKIGSTYGSHVDTMYQIFNNYKDKFVIVGEFKMPDNSIVNVYQRL